MFCDLVIWSTTRFHQPINTVYNLNLISKHTFALSTTCHWLRLITRNTGLLLNAYPSKTSLWQNHNLFYFLLSITPSRTLLCSVQNYSTIWQFKLMLWTNEISLVLSLRYVSGRCPVLKKLPWFCKINQHVKTIFFISLATLLTWRLGHFYDIRWHHQQWYRVLFPIHSLYPIGSLNKHKSP